jgi:hypothetical protein
MHTVNIQVSIKQISLEDGVRMFLDVALETRRPISTTPPP